MNTFQLECFLAVANTLSFARASVQMNISQPAITHQIKTLEEELNTKLFKRSTRFVELTQEGISFINDAKNIIAISLQAKMKFNSDKEEAINSLSIGCSNSIQLNSLKQVLEKLNKEIINFHPKITIQNRGQLFYLLENGSIDLFFDHYDDNKLKDNIKYKELYEEKLVCIGKDDNPLFNKELLSINDIKKEKMIFLDPMYLTSKMAKFQFKLIENKSSLDCQFCSSFEICSSLVEAGLGISFVPETFFDNSKNIIKRDLSDSIKLSYGIFYRKNADDQLIKKIIKCFI